MAEVRLTYTIRGITPLLMHNPSSMAPKSGDDSTSGRRGVAQKLTQEQEAEKSCYRSPDGYLVFPAQAFRSSLLNAAEKWPIPGKARGNISSYLTHIQVEPEEFVQVCDLNGEYLREYEIDGRHGVNPSTGGGIWITRAKLREWQTTLTFVVDKDMLPDPEPIITPILEDAGKRIGVGAFRPQPPKSRTSGRGGWFGRYRIVTISQN